MGPHVAGFEAWLLVQGYTPGTVRGGLKVVGRLGLWMAAEDVDVTDLTCGVIEAFRVARRESGCRCVPSMRSFRPLLVYLVSIGALDVETPPLASPVEALVAEYRKWLVVERGLAATTVLRYVSLAGRFLEERVVATGDRFVNELTGVDVIAFLVRETQRFSVGAAKGRVAELRALLKFLYLKGVTEKNLATAVPAVAGWHDTTVPGGLVASDVERLLDRCDRDTSVGARDFAILMLVARLGLRSIEVARLELGDIDWRAGEIVVRGKARRHDRLPLPHDVGDALAAYLSDGRPVTTIRQVFMALKAPRRAIRADLVSDVTRRACERAGLPRVGAHRLRHALASEMLRRGATLVEVSQVLRHRDLATTAIYAKVDFVTLRRVAQPWPGAEQ